MIIDADAHVVETEHTWDYLDQSDKNFRPQLFQSCENSSAQCWFLDGKIIGFRNPTLTISKAIRPVGNKPFIFSSDYPHEVDAETCRAELEELQENPRVTSEDKEAILFSNSARFYRLSLD